MRIFISPCGTSLLTNGVSADLRSRLFATANNQAADLSPEDKTLLDDHLAERRQWLLAEETDFGAVKRRSAELNGLLTYYGSQLPNAQQRAQDYHYILSSDTYQGEKVANIIVEWLTHQGFNAHVYTIKDLSTKDLSAFRAAMSDLIQWCDELLAPCLDDPHTSVIFNLTGGFKSVNGFLQTIGMFYADESIYIFQTSDRLLRLPKLPIRLDTEGAIAGHLTAFRQLGRGQSLAVEDCAGLPETLLFEDGGRVILSEWGELVWRQGKRSYYQAELLPPLSDKLVYSQAFIDDAQEVKDRLQLQVLNERLDELSQYLDAAVKTKADNPSALDFKSIHPTAKQPKSTHECYIWPGRGARLFGHFRDDGRYEIDRLGKHL